MSRDCAPLLLRIDQLVAAQDWDGALNAIDAAKATGCERSRYGVPLDFVRAEIEQRRGASATVAAETLLSAADQARNQGDQHAARRALAQALAVEHLPPDTIKRIRAQIERLDAQFGLGGTASDVDAQLKDLLVDLRTSRPTLYRLLVLCAVPRWLDAPVIAVLRQKSDGREEEVLARINAYSFIYPWDGDRYTMSEDARQALLAGWQDDPDGYRAANARLAEHFADRLAVDPPRDPAVKERLRHARLYHTFLANLDAGVELLGRYFQAAEDAHQLVTARQYVLTLQPLRTQIPAPYFAYIEYAEGWLHHLMGSEHAAGFIFAALAAREDLAPDLRARVVRGRAAVLVEDGAWREGLAAFQQALDQFKALDEADEVAETMAHIGRAYLQIAADAMGEYDPLMAEYTGQTGALALGALLVRLPLILYLIRKLGIFWPLPNLMRLGQGLDWVIARLFSDAILWLRQAEQAYAALNHQAGVSRTQEALGRLHWILNDPQRAVTFLAPLLDDYVPGSFAWARVEQELGEAYLAQDEAAAAQTQLQRALPIFEKVSSHARIAQCHERLGTIAASQAERDTAARHYVRALHAWQEASNPVRVTQMEHRLAALAAGGGLSESGEDLVESARGNVSEAVYATRYIHPFSLFYQRTAIILFAVLIGLLSLINVQLRPTIDLVSKLTLDASQLERMNYTLDQSVRLAAEVAVEPAPLVILLVSALALLLFILLYAAGGSYLLRRISIQSLQDSFSERVEIDAHGIRWLTAGGRVEITWDEAQQAVYSTRSFCRRFIDLFSVSALTSERARIEISGLVQGYEYVEQSLRAQLASRQMDEQDLSVNFLCRGWGLLFVAGMALQALFLFAALIGEEWLQRTLPWLHYTYADLWNVIEVAVALPLLYWLLIQPARFRLYARNQIGNLGMLWGMAFITLLISFSTIQMGRPAILAGVASLFIGMFVLYDLRGLDRLESPAPANARALTRGWRIALIVGTVTLMATAAFSLFVELRSFRHQAIGYERFMQTQDVVDEASPELRAVLADAQRHVIDTRSELNYMRNQPEAWIAERSADPQISVADARELLPVERRNAETQLALAETELAQRQAELDQLGLGFQDAKASFARSIEIKPDAVPYRFLIITQAYLNEYDEAIETFETMQQRGLVRPQPDSELLTQVLHQGGLNVSDLATKQTAWQRAADFYDLRLDDPTLGASERDEIEHLRAALLVSLAGISDGQVRPMLEEAEQIFSTRVAALERAASGEGASSALANAYAELGTVHLLRGLDAPVEDEARRTAFIQAQTAFEESIAADASTLAAYNGLAWSLYEQSRIVPGSCLDGFARAEEAAQYIDLVEKAVAAFDGALESPAAEALTEAGDDRWLKTGATYLRTRAQLHYILADCDDDAVGYDRAEYLRLARDDYLAATAQDPRASWINRLGDIQLQYARELEQRGRPDAPTQQRWRAVDNYAKVVALDQGYFATRQKLYQLLRDDLRVDNPETEAINRIIEAMRLIEGGADRSRNPDFFLKFAQEEETRARGVPALAAAAVTHALSLEPDNQAALLLAGPLYEQWARPATGDTRTTRLRLALDALEQGLMLEPDDAGLWMTKGRVNLALGDTRTAIADIEQALTLAPEDPALHYALALAHLLNGEQTQAERLYEKASVLAVSFPPAEVKATYAQAISDLLVSDGSDLDDRAALAIGVAETALGQQNIAMDDLTALRNRAQTANDDGDYEGSIPLWTKVIQLDPEENRNWQNMRSALILSPNFGQVQSGEAMLTLLTGLFEGSERDVLHRVAQIDLNDGVYGLAAAAMERALMLDPQDGDAYAKLAETYFRWGQRWNLPMRLEQAVALIDRAAAANVERAEVYHYASLALRNLQRYAEAIAAGQQAVTLDPTYRTAFSRLGWTAYLAGDYALSIDASRAAIDLDPTDPREHFNLGLAYIAQGDVEQANAAYTAGLAAAADATNAGWRAARISEALGDLRRHRADPATIVPDVILRLENARAN